MVEFAKDAITESLAGETPVTAELESTLGVAVDALAGIIKLWLIMPDPLFKRTVPLVGIADSLLWKVGPLAGTADPFLRFVGPLVGAIGPLLTLLGPLVGIFIPLMWVIGPFVEAIGPLLETISLLGTVGPVRELPAPPSKSVKSNSIDPAGT